MTRLFLDFETYSKVDLKKCGLDVYARDKSTKVLMLAFAFGNGPVEQWVPAEGEKMPRHLRDALDDPEVIKSAWNAPFERAIFRHVLGIKIPAHEWRCTMALASTISLPMSLAKAGEVLGVQADKKKDSRGKALIRKFCGPRKPTKTKKWTRCTWVTDPEDWEDFKFYNRQDIEAERENFRKLRKWDLSAEEWDLWALDQIINQRGIPINLDVVDNAVEVIEYCRNIRYDEMQEITGLENPRSNQQLLPWLQEHGYVYDDLKAGHVRRALEDAQKLLDDDMAFDDTEDLARVLQLRSEVSKTSLDKFFALHRATADDGNLRGSLQFAGAGRTWRWSGRIYQPQNLARPTKEFEEPEDAIAAVTDLEHLSGPEIEKKYERPIDMLSACVRPVVQAPPGYVLIDADLNAIENRVLGWIADDRKILDVFHKDRDPYIDFAKYMFHASYDELYAEYKDGDKTKRTTAKPGVLGCGYMLSAGYEYENDKTGEIEATGLLGYAWNMGVKLTQEQAQHSVDTWRSTFTDAVTFWYDLERAAKKCIRTGKETHCGVIGFDLSGPLMRMILPSGRCLHYVRPRIENKLMPWKKYKDVITYEGLNDKNQWTRIQTHPGKLTENADQAIARDVLAHGMRLAEDEGIKIRFHVHDQIIAAVKEKHAEEDLQILLECMGDTPKWAKGLPLKAAGSVTKYFLKD